MEVICPISCASLFLITLFLSLVADSTKTDLTSTNFIDPILLLLDGFQLLTEKGRENRRNGPSNFLTLCKSRKEKKKRKKEKKVQAREEDGQSKRRLIFITPFPPKPYPLTKKKRKYLASSIRMLHHVLLIIFPLLAHYLAFYR